MFHSSAPSHSPKNELIGPSTFRERREGLFWTLKAPHSPPDHGRARKSSSCYYSWMCPGSGGNHVCPECTLGPSLRGERKASFGAPAMGLQHGEDEAIPFSQCRKNRKPSDKDESARLGLLSIPGACTSGLEVPEQHFQTLGSSTQPFSLSHLTAGQNQGDQVQILPTSIHHSGLLLGDLAKETTTQASTTSRG